MIGAAGFDMIDLGVDVPVEKFVETIEANPDVKVVALSALLTTTMQSMADTAEALKPLREKYGFKMIVGGAPITQAFADEIGADGYSVDAGAAAILAKEVIA
jgi:methanogenic corrinoid protein MtbC1